MIAVWIAAPLPGPIGTWALLLTAHASMPALAMFSGKNLSPQFTSVSVSATTCVIAGTTLAHFELGPQFVSPPPARPPAPPMPPAPHDMPL